MFVTMHKLSLVKILGAVAAVVALQLSWTTVASAQAVDLGALGIVWDFEEPEVTHSNTGEAHNDIGIPSWTFELLAGASNDHGVQDPNETYYGPFSGPAPTGTLPAEFQGRQLGFINLNDAGVSSAEIVSDPIGGLVAGQTLTLNVAVGARAVAAWSDIRYEIGLRTTGGTNLGTFTMLTIDPLPPPAAPALPTPNIEDMTYMLNVDAEAAAFVGEEVHIVIRGTNVVNATSGFAQANFDNVRFSGTLAAVNQPVITINRDNGQITIGKTGSATYAIAGYELSSTTYGSFNSAAWTKVSVAYDDSGNGSVDPDNDWTVVSPPGSTTDLAEIEFEGGNGGILTSAAAINLGTPWIQTPYEDVTASILLDDGTEIVRPVTWEGTPVVAGDLNADNAINVTDWTAFKAGHATNLSGMSIAQAYAFGDMNQDKLHNLSDFTAFRAAYNLVNGEGAFQAMLASVPEPSSLLLLVAGAVVAGAMRRTRHMGTGMAALMIAAGVCGTGGPAHADLVAGYNFEGSADDVSENGLNGILRNAAMLVSDPDPARGMVLALDGADTNLTSTYVDINDPTGLLNFSASGPNQGSSTVMAWVFSDDYVNPRQVFSQGEWNDGVSLNVKGDSDDTLWVAGTNRSDLSVPVGGWQHIAVTRAFDGTNTAIKFYINGALTGYSEGTGNLTGRVNAPVNNNALGGSRIGAEWRDTNATNLRFVFDGRIDEVGIFDAALTQAEVQGFMTGFPGSINLDLRVDPVTGQMGIYNDNPNPMTISSYEITSTAASLDSSTWAKISTQSIPGFPTGNGSGDGWEAGPFSSDSEITEWLLDDDVTSTVGVGQVVNLGFAFDEAMNVQDLQFKYTDGSGALKSGTVLYTGVPVTFAAGDFDKDGDVDNTDLGIWKGNFGNAATDMTGDANGDLRADGADFLIWQRNLNQVPSPLAAVPEPAAGLLVAMAGVALAAGRVRRTKRLRPSAAAVRRVGFLAALLAVTAAAGSAHAAFTLDRVYRMGESEGGVPTATLPPGAVTWDDQGLGSTGQLNDLQVPTMIAAPHTVQSSPAYVAVAPDANRPAASGVGIQFDGVSDFLFGLRFGNPSTTPSATNPPATVPLDYAGLRNRGFQLWIRPESGGPTNQSIVRDTDDHGVMIEGGTWRMRYDESTINSNVAVVNGLWHHVMVVRPFGSTGANGGSFLYLNGVAIARDSGDYGVAPDGTAPEPVNEDGLWVGVSTAEDGSPDYFKGTIDQLEMFVLGTTTNMVDRGTFNYATDNPIANAFLSHVPGDVDQMNGLTQADVTAFIAGWKSRKVVNGIQVGDITTIVNGDLNLDGATNLTDAAILRDALSAAGLPALNFSALGVPEPSSILLAAPLAYLLARRRRSTRNAA